MKALKNYLNENFASIKRKLKPTKIASDNLVWDKNIKRLCKLIPRGMQAKCDDIDKYFSKWLYKYCFVSEDETTVMALLDSLLEERKEFNDLFWELHNDVMNSYSIDDKYISDVNTIITNLIKSYAKEIQTKMKELL